MTDKTISDDFIFPFQIETSGARGRFIRLGPAITQILDQHDYPEAVSRLLGEALVLAAMLGASLKIDGQFILQASSEGPVRFVVAQYHTPGNLRGYASFDRDAFPTESVKNQKTLEDTKDVSDTPPLLQGGTLVMTIDQGPDTERYQGVVALRDGDLTSAADLYFAQSEQIPSFIRVAVARQYHVPKDSTSGTWSWRAGGLMVQKLTHEGGVGASGHSAASADDADMDEDDAWERAKIFASTVEDYELLEPTLSAENVLYRLFHEEQVRVFPKTPLRAFCHCSEDRVKNMLAVMAPGEIEMLTQDGRIQVTCEFCSRCYEVDAPPPRVP
jgi:molecular chaperone Hsp33